jgi:hypothetical protein
VVASSAVDSLFQHQSGQTKDYKIGICSFSAMHAALQHRSSQTKNYKRYLFLLSDACSIKKKEQRLFGSDKG